MVNRHGLRYRCHRLRTRHRSLDSFKCCRITVSLTALLHQHTSQKKMTKCTTGDDTSHSSRIRHARAERIKSSWVRWVFSVNSAQLAPEVLYACKSEESFEEAEAKNKHLETLSRSFVTADVLWHSNAQFRNKVSTEKREKTDWIPDLSFFSKISHLLRNKTRSTFSRSLFEQTAFQRSTESS